MQTREIFILLLMPFISAKETESQDECDNKTKIAIKEKIAKLTEAKYTIMSLGHIASTVASAFPGDSDTVVQDTGVFTKTIGFVLGFAEDINQKPLTEETEHLRCVGEDTKQMNEEIGASFDEVNVMLDELKTEMRYQFGILKQKLDALRETPVRDFKNLLEESNNESKTMVTEMWQKETTKDYNETMNKIAFLQSYLDKYDPFADDMADKRTNAKRVCMDVKPSLILRNMHTGIVGSLLDSSSTYYPLLRAWCRRIYADVISVFHAHAACIAIDGSHTTEEARTQEVEEMGKEGGNIFIALNLQSFGHSHLGGIAEQIVKHMDTKMREQKNKVFDNVTETALRKLPEISEEPGQAKCIEYGDQVYEHLMKLAPWTDWAVETIYPAPGSESPSIWSAGDDYNTYHLCKLSIIACERRNSEQSKETAQHFVKWATTKYNASVCPWIYRGTTATHRAHEIYLTFVEQLRFPDRKHSRHILIREGNNADISTRFSSVSTSDALAKGLSSCKDTEAGKDASFMFYVCFS